MFHQILGLIALVAIPIVLLGVLFVYLKRAAPGGSVPASAAAPAPAKPEPLVDGPGSRVTGARKCRSCGMVTTSAMIGGSVPRCQNCNAALPPA